MNERMKQLALRAGIKITPMVVDGIEYEYEDVDMDGSEDLAKFAKLLIEETLRQVDERTCGRGDTSWYNDDKEWVRLHFGYGKLTK